MGREFPGSPVVSVLRSPCGEPGFKLCVVAKKKHPKTPKNKNKEEMSIQLCFCPAKKVF